MVHLGFSQATISWYKSYLTNRTFLVNVEKNLSSPVDLTCGVPQGSILGPLIFILYENDMSNSVDCDLLLYADYSCLVFTGPDLKTIIKREKKNYIKEKLTENIGNSKELKTLKKLGLPSKKDGQTKICLEKEGNISFDAKEFLC